MQPEPGEQQEKCQSNPRPTPFNVQHNLDKSSFNSSSASDCCSQGAPVCTCGSLTGWSSIQLQEQHLLGACSRSPQDMFVVVLTNAEQQAADSSAQQQKPRASPAAADSSSQASQSTGGRQTFAQYLLKQVCCGEQNPRQMTQEYCLRLVALLLVVVATVGLAYRLARRDS